MIQTKQLTKTLLISSLALMSAYGYAMDYSASFGTSLIYNGNGVSSDATDLDNVAYGSFGISNHLTDGITFSFAVTADDEGGKSGHMKFDYTGIDGLTLGVGLSDSDRNAVTGDKKDAQSLYAKYALGAFTIGVQMRDFKAENVEDTDAESLAYSISYAVSDDVSISYGQSTIDYDSSSEDEDYHIVSASFGLMDSGTLSLSYTEVDNIAATSNQDAEGYQLSFSWAF